MAGSNIQNTTTDAIDSKLNINKILTIVLANWYWFVLSLLILLATTKIYLKYTPLYIR